MTGSQSPPEKTKNDELGSLGIMMRSVISLLLILLVGCATAPKHVASDSPTVAPGDHLVIVVTNRECPEIREVVDASGDISLPLAGKRHVGGMTLEQAAKAIEDVYWSSGCFGERIRISLSRL